jgi:hypothetical protein
MTFVVRFLFFVFLFACDTAIAQEYEVPAKLPSTREEFSSSEKDVIAAAKWLESKSIGSDMEKRVKVNAWVLGWIVNSPSVSIEINAAFAKLFEKNPHLNIVWMAGYSRYGLENNYSPDKIQANMAGLKSVIRCYNLGDELKKDKALAKMMDADREGRLEDWVKEALTKK